MGLWRLGDQKAQQFLICDGQLIQDVDQTIERIHVRDDLFHAGRLVDEVHAMIRIAVLAAVRLVNGGLSGATGSIAFFPLEVCLITQTQFVAFVIARQPHSITGFRIIEPALTIRALGQIGFRGKAFDAGASGGLPDFIHNVVVIIVQFLIVQHCRSSSFFRRLALKSVRNRRRTRGNCRHGRAPFRATSSFCRQKRGAYKYSNEATCRLLGVWLILALPIGSRPGRRSCAQYTTQVIEVFGYA